MVYSNRALGLRKMSNEPIVNMLTGVTVETFKGI